MISKGFSVPLAMIQVYHIQKRLSIPFQIFFCFNKCFILLIQFRDVFDDAVSCNGLPPEHRSLTVSTLYHTFLYLSRPFWKNFQKFFDFWKADICQGLTHFHRRSLDCDYSIPWHQTNVNTFWKEILHKFEMTVYRHKTEMMGTIEPDLSISSVICCAYCINGCLYTIIIYKGNVNIKCYFIQSGYKCIIVLIHSYSEKSIRTYITIVLVQ